jgi:hypothetical protein
VREFNDEHPKKQRSPIVVIKFGIVSNDNDEH